MVARRLDLNKHEELNLRIYTLCKHTCWSYGKIAQELRLSKSQVIDVMKRHDEHGGDVCDASSFGCPTKITKVKKKRILEVVNENPSLIFREITNIVDVGLGYLVINNFFCNFGFSFRILRNKSFWIFGQKEKHKEFAQRRWQWNLHQWRKVVFINEAMIAYDLCLARKKVIL